MINIELEKMYYDDIADRESNLDDKVLEEKSLKRLKNVYHLIKTNQIDETEIWNLHYTALLLHHGNSIKDYKLAHDYCKKALKLGSNVTKWLYAVTLDRYLLSIGKKQKFGTQIIMLNNKNQIAPYETKTTDAERAKYYVPPLKDILKNYNSKINKPK